MNDASRIDALSPVATLPRQTQKNDFGEKVSSAMTTVARQGLSLVGGAMSTMPILSSAAAGIQSVASLGHGSSLTAVPSTTLPGVSSAAPATSLAGSLSTLTASSSNTMQGVMQQLTSGGDLSPTQYLLLQQSMTEESQQYTTASNIMKVRSDSAKSAINNIR
jgi:hypothetical protein